MVKLYFAKVNINSNINEISKQEVQCILERLFTAIDDGVDHVKEIPFRYTNENDEVHSGTREERYNFSQIDKDEETKIITGWLVRRMPTHIEEFDDEERVSVPTTYDNTSASTMFYFNCKEEIITFTTRGRLGYLQIMEAFESLFGTYIEDVSFKIYLIKNPYDIDETLRRMKKVRKITTTLIPPNAANRAALEALFEEKAEQLKDANVTTEKIIWETDKKNKNGLNKVSKRFMDLIDLIKAFAEKGYGSTELEGENSNGDFIEFDSNADAPYLESIPEVNKEDRQTIINTSNQGIQKLTVKRTIDRMD